ncbi:MAG: apolipoprotein N-acyltransferase [Comamonadaceae bacterium]|nr:apolipoprotein N-acyltransferase [Comamonadaceae bacterium]
MRLRAWLASPLAAVAAGLAQAAALADPWTGQPHGWLQVLSLAWLAWQLLSPPSAARPGMAPSAPAGPSLWWHGARQGGLFALAWLAGTFWWLFISMHTYGGLMAPLAALAVVALAGFLALYYAAASALFSALRPAHGALAAIFFAALWTLAELGRGTLLTGFPWGAGGYAHVDSTLAALARYVGVYGVGGAAALGAALLAALLALPRRRASGLTLAALLAALAGAGWTHQAAVRAPGLPALRMDVALLQGNIPQDEKFVPGTGVIDSLRWYGTQLRDARAPLVVAPETALPLLPAQLPEGYWQRLRERYGQGDQAALLGVPLGSAEEGYTNSVVGLAAPATHAPYRYDKHHLVPFGEFIPPLFKWFVRLMNIPLGDFDRGAVGQPSFEWRGQRLAPNICYEDLFGEELAARFAHTGQAPTAFVNLSNIAWFGDTVAIDQHLHISRMRALEFERPMLRATNTGATAIIDHRGRVTHQLPRLTRDVLTGSFEGRTALTPFARWAAVWGLAPLWALCALLAAGAAWAGRRPRRA